MPLCSCVDYGKICSVVLIRVNLNSVLLIVLLINFSFYSLGLDALVRELKSGRVTLRRNRRKTQTNDALQEMFQVLEISQKQNRNSKICVDMNF